jgi:hypothetical protein
MKAEAPNVSLKDSLRESLQAGAGGGVEDEDEQCRSCATA